MGLTRKKDQTKGKICRERVESLEFVEEEREAYLKAQSKRRVTAKKKKYLEREEEKREAKREKRKEERRRELERADIAERLLERSQRKEDLIEKQIGNSHVTIREL